MRPTPLFVGKGARGRTGRGGRRCGRVGPDGYRVPGRGAALSPSRRSAVIVAMHDTDATTTGNTNAGGLQRRGLGPAQGEQREPGGLRPRVERSGAEVARRRRQRARRGAARQRGGDRGAGATERRGQPGRSATGRSATRHEVERRAGGVRPGGRPGQRVPDHARRPGLPGASERAPRAPGHTDPAAATNGSAAEGRAKRARTPTRRRLAKASRDARTAAVEAFAAAQWAQRGPRRTHSAVADVTERSNAKRRNDGRRRARCPPRSARAPERARRRRWGWCSPDWSDARSAGRMQGS